MVIFMVLDHTDTEHSAIVTNGMFRTMSLDVKQASSFALMPTEALGKYLLKR